VKSVRGVWFILLIAVSALGAAGCGGTRAGLTVKEILGRGGPDVALVPGDSDFSTGQIRLSFLVIRPNQSIADRSAARVWVASSEDSRPFLTTTATAEPVGVPRRSFGYSKVLRLYVAHFAIRKAGTYAVVAAPVGGDPIQAFGEIIVKRVTISPHVGSKAFPSDTPTIASVDGDLAKLTTRVPPDASLLRYSVAESLAAHKPIVLVFATPAFCQSRTCGPVVDVVDQVRRRFAGTGIRFIHVEIYKDNDPRKGPNRWVKEWRLPSEPWTFLIGRDGRIKAKFEGSVAAAELAQAVRHYLVGAASG
jgi:hypothetical protein